MAAVRFKEDLTTYFHKRLAQRALGFCMTAVSYWRLCVNIQEYDAYPVFWIALVFVGFSWLADIADGGSASKESLTLAFLGWGIFLATIALTACLVRMQHGFSAVFLAAVAAAYAFATLLVVCARLIVRARRNSN